MQLHEQLSLFNKNHLKTLTKLIPSSLKKSASGEAKDGYIKQLCEALLGPNVQKLVDALSPTGKLALSHVIHDGWETLDEERFLAWHDQPSSLYPENRVYSTNPTWEPSPLWLFFYPPLSWAYDYPRPFGDGEPWRIPSDLVANLKKRIELPRQTLAPPEPLAAAPAKLTLSSPDRKKRIELELSLYDQHELAHQELLAVLELAQAGKLKFTGKRRKPSAATLRAVQDVLKSPEFLHDEHSWKSGAQLYPGLAHDRAWLLKLIGSRRANAWLELLCAAGLIDLHDNGKVTINAQGISIQHEPAERAIRRVWERWLMSSQATDELEWIFDLKGFRPDYPGLYPLSIRRQRLHDQLAALTPARWYELTTLTRTMIANGNFTWSMDDAGGLYLGDRFNTLSGRASWPLGVSSLKLLLGDIAATLGLVALRHFNPALELTRLNEQGILTPYDHIFAIKLTPLGEAVFLADEPLEALDEAALGELHVQPDRSIVATGHLPGELSLLLDEFTLSTGPLTWKLDRKTLLKAHEQGKDIERFERELLKAAQQDKLPKTVKSFFEDAHRRATMIQAPKALLCVEFKEKAVAYELAHDKKLKDIVELYKERFLLLDEVHLKTLRSVARKLDYAFPTQD